MRIPAILTAMILLCPLLAPAASGAQAPASSSMPACKGVYNILRVSEITPGASMQNFMAAVAAQQEWYKSHGFSDVIFAAPVIVRDPATHAESYSNSEMITYHYIAPGKPAPMHDASWDAKPTVNAFP